MKCLGVERTVREEGLANEKRIRESLSIQVTEACKSTVREAHDRREEEYANLQRMEA